MPKVETDTPEHINIDEELFKFNCKWLHKDNRISYAKEKFQELTDKLCAIMPGSLEGVQCLELLKNASDLAIIAIKEDVEDGL